MPTDRDQLMTAELARALFEYDRESGVIRWKVNASTRARVGDEAGIIQCGMYRRIGFNGRYYMAHRLAWLIVNGEWPCVTIDHRNGVKSDNRWSNLREATHAQNNQNTLHANKSGLQGAAWSSIKGKWRASVRVGKSRLFLGWFDSAEDAHRAYMGAAKVHHGEFAHEK